MRVIGMLLGIPESEQPAVRDRSDAVLRTEAGQPMAVRQEAIANGDMYAEYVDWRVDHPSDDLMTALLNAEFEDEDGRDAPAHPRRGAHLHAGAGRRRATRRPAG